MQFSQFFKDTGEFSMMRLVTFMVIIVILLVFAAVNIIAALKGGEVKFVDFPTNTVEIILIMIGGKVLQSFSENRAVQKSGP